MQKVDPFCKEILSGNGLVTDQFVKTDDGFLRRIPPGEVDALKIVVPEALRPRILKLTHNMIFAGHPCQKRKYVRLKKRFYRIQMALDVLKTVQKSEPFTPHSVIIEEAQQPTRAVPS